MIMACVLERAFKDEYSVNLVKTPEVPGDKSALYWLSFAASQASVITKLREKLFPVIDDT